MISVFYLVQYTSFRLVAPIRVFLYIGVMARMLSLVFFGYIVLGTSNKTNALILMSINSVMVLPLVQAYLIMPVKIVFVKVVPHSIEGLMTGIMQSIIVFNSEFLMRLVGVLYQVRLDFTILDYAGYWKVYAWSSINVLIVSVIALYFCNISREDTHDLQVMINDLDLIKDGEKKADIDIQKSMDVVANKPGYG
jgi:hypothetical protein